jgi:HEAT repeat protein
MDPVAVARQFCRLVSLLALEPASVDEQKSLLRSLVVSAKGGMLTLAIDDGRLMANGAPVSEAFAGVPALTRRLHALRAAAIDVSIEAGAAELLGVARLLAASLPLDDADAAAAGLRAWPASAQVRFVPYAAPPALPATRTSATDTERTEVADTPGRTLQSVAARLPREPARREELLAILVLAGAEGAAAVIEQIASADEPSERRCYVDVLRQLRAGIPALIGVLADPRWFVVRNAAELLGEMRATSAEEALTVLLQHDDDRVRRAASGALMRLGTPRSLQTIRTTLRGGVPELRIAAALALATREDVRPATPLIQALETEADADVRAAILRALGRVGSPDAVRRLLEACAPQRRFFRRTLTTLRVAAVQGLGEARSAAALQGLNGLLADRETAVRDAATSAMSRIVRQAMAGVPASAHQRAVRSVSAVTDRQNSASSVAAASTSRSETISFGECM